MKGAGGVWKKKNGPSNGESFRKRGAGLRAPGCIGGKKGDENIQKIVKRPKGGE